MKLHQAAVGAGLLATALCCHALTDANDDELRVVGGKDGVSILANLNVDIGSYKYTDTDPSGGSISRNGIHVGGVLALTIDVINVATFQGILTSLGVSNGATNTFSATSDVVQISFPNVPMNSAAMLSISTASTTMGNSTASFGSHAINQIDLRGTSVWIWAH
jgi:hypothetical protein